MIVVHEGRDQDQLGVHNTPTLFAQSPLDSIAALLMLDTYLGEGRRKYNSLRVHIHPLHHPSNDVIAQPTTSLFQSSEIFVSEWSDCNLFHICLI